MSTGNDTGGGYAGGYYTGGTSAGSNRAGEQRHSHRPPRDCPVCGSRFEVTRLGCASCGSELSGVFEACAFCGLSGTERGLLEVFLVSRGNMREVERHLGVSYPTARQRYAELLAKLGFEGDTAEPEPVLTRPEILAKLAQGDLDVETATRLLRTAK